MYTDACVVFWGVLITEGSREVIKQPLLQQEHKPISLLKNPFKGAQCHWSAFKKKAYAIFQVFKKLENLFLGSSKTHVFTDHRNIYFSFSINFKQRAFLPFSIPVHD